MNDPCRWYVRVDSGVVGFRQRSVVKDDYLGGAAQLPAERLRGEQIHEDLAVANHGDEGQRGVIGLNWGRAEKRTAVEIEPGSSQGSPSAKEHFLSTSNKCEFQVTSTYGDRE
jgi:hypothetical protein